MIRGAVRLEDPTEDVDDPSQCLSEEACQRIKQAIENHTPKSPWHGITFNLSITPFDLNLKMWIAPPAVNEYSAVCFLAWQISKYL